MESRGISEAELQKITDEAAIEKPEDAVGYKLITNVGYWDEFEESIRQKIGVDKDKKVEYVSLSSYKNADKLIKEGDSANKIAFIVGEGEIVSGKGSSESIGSEKMVASLKKAREDKKVKAIVLRINSPGGSALASDVMWREIELTKKVKPVIASMSDLAASGGYYMAMGCDTIVAQPNTITGSIGIFGILFNMQDFLNNKLGITFDCVKTHKYADFPTVTREMTEVEKAKIQSSVNRGYETFTGKAAQGRKMAIEKLKSMAGGRVWSGEEAKANGLVDVLGGIDDAIKIAAQKANLKEGEYRIKYLPAKRSMIQQLLDDMEEDNTEARLKALLGYEIAPFANIIKRLHQTDVQPARMGFDIEIK